MAGIGIAALVLVSGGCSSSPPPKPRNEQSNLAPVPAAQRGLVGTEVQFRNVSATLVSGFGIVVGLSGTGGLPLNDTIAASMERQMALAGMTSTNTVLRGTPFEGKTPREILRDPNVAVVTVSAAIAPGLPIGTTFDVQVEAINATSLEGGTLWTTDLRIGGPSAFGQAQATKLGEASGAVFLNPFGTTSRETSGGSETVGRVLGGGTLTDSLRVVMTLNTPSHQRARQIVSAINSRFPQGPGDDGPAARGENDTNLRLNVPLAHRTEPAAFLRLVQSIQIDQSAPELYARRYVETIKSEPGQAENMAWALEALGPRVTPVLRELYTHPDIAPRMAGLRAGARLNDPLTVKPLQDVIRSGQGTVRTQAIELLGLVDGGPRVDLFLRELLREGDLLVRIAAYEALAGRAEKVRFNQLVRTQRESPDLRRSPVSIPQLEAIARVSLPSGSLQGVAREPIEGKFLLDRVPEGEPLIYITQQRVPRVVLFGSDDGLSLSGIRDGIGVWGNRLMIAPDSRPATARVRLQRPGRPAITHSVPAKLANLIGLLARETTPSDPRPGFNLSYSEVVATLSRLEQAGATRATFATERDRLEGLLLAAQNSRDMTERPETDADDQAVVVRRGGTTPTPANPGDETPTIVPIEPPAQPK